MRSSRTAALAGALLMFGGLLTGCGDGDGVSLPSASVTLPTALPTPSPTRTPSLPTRTPEPTPSETAENTPAPSRSTVAPTSTPTPTSQAPSASPTPTQTVTATATATVTATPTPSETPSPTPTPSETPSETPTPSPTPAAAGEDTGGVPWWVWLLLGLVVVGGGAWLAVAASRRRAWDERYGGLLAEARWVHDSLAPSVTNRLTPDAQVQQQWPDGKRRLDDLQAGLYQLGPKVPDDTRAGRLNRVSGAVAALGSALAEDVALRGPAVASSAEALARSAQTVEACRGRLLAAIDDLPVDGS